LIFITKPDALQRFLRKPTIDYYRTTMIVYNYHPVTKVFGGTEEADPDPMEHGRYLIPANSTVKPIPENVPENSDIVWNTEKDIWEIKDTPKIPIEVVWSKIRQERNRRLVETDWMFIIRDYVMSNEKEYAWRKYRQELRDLPKTLSDPYNPVWPSKPI
jgi:hypothetical protein